MKNQDLQLSLPPEKLETLHSDENLVEKLDRIYEEMVKANEYNRIARLESQALFTKKEILMYIGYPNLNSRDIVEGYEKMKLLKSCGGRPKLYPGYQVRQLKLKLSTGQLGIPKK